MNLSLQEKEKLATFLGCGNINASIWFIGMEPGSCEACLSLEENIRVRINYFGKTISLSEAHHLLKEDNQKLSQVWLFAAKIVLSLTNTLGWNDIQKVKNYIHTEFGTKNGITLSAELLPLPRPSTNIWPNIYKGLFQNYEIYKETILKERLEFLRKNIIIYKPKFVFAYCKNYHNEYCKLGDDSIKWEYLPRLLNLSFPNENYLVGQALSSVLIGISNETIYILLPFLGNGQISNKDIEIITKYLKDSFSDKIQKITTN